MPPHYDVLILGASYGSLLATKLLLAGHDATLVCTPATAALIAREGTRVRMPIKGRPTPVEIDSRELPGRLGAAAPDSVDPAAFDLVALAMQEPQYTAPGVRPLMERIAAAKVPCLSIMNMPPPPYLARLPGLDAAALDGCYTDPDLWRRFVPGLVTLCSPDPQAVRPAGQPANRLQVNLATNFKTARFESEAHTAMLRRLQSDIDGARLATPEGPVDVPVKIKEHESLFVPLAKWSMLVAGNYRSIGERGMRPIAEAVHADPAAARAIYARVNALCRELGAADADLVPFEKYAEAARSLANPSSVARALAAGATAIERVDRVVQAVAAQRGLANAALDEIVAVVDTWVARNRAAAPSA